MVWEVQDFPAQEAQATRGGATELSGGAVITKRDVGNRGSVHLSSSLECSMLRPGQQGKEPCFLGVPKPAGEECKHAYIALSYGRRRQYR